MLLIWRRYFLSTHSSDGSSFVCLQLQFNIPWSLVQFTNYTSAMFWPSINDKFIGVGLQVFGSGSQQDKWFVDLFYNTCMLSITWLKVSKQSKDILLFVLTRPSRQNSISDFFTTWKKLCRQFQGMINLVPFLGTKNHSTSFTLDTW